MSLCVIVGSYNKIKKEKIMAKTVGTTHNVLKIFGIKIFEYYSDYICNETACRVGKCFKY